VAKGNVYNTTAMILKAKQRITGSYGTVNEGDTVEVPEAYGQGLIEKGLAEEVKKPNETATPEEVTEHNQSGLQQEPIHASGMDREMLNNEGRRLHESGPEAVEETEARAKANVEPTVLGDVTDEPKKAKKA